MKLIAKGDTFPTSVAFRDAFERNMVVEGRQCKVNKKELTKACSLVGVALVAFHHHVPLKDNPECIGCQECVSLSDTLYSDRRWVGRTSSRGRVQSKVARHDAEETICLLSRSKPLGVRAVITWPIPRIMPFFLAKYLRVLCVSSRERVSSRDAVVVDLIGYLILDLRI